MPFAYTRLAQRVGDDGDKAEPFNATANSASIANRTVDCAQWILSRGWVFSTFTLLALLLAQSTYLYSMHRPSYESGYSTELDALKSSLELHERRFTGPIHDDVNGSMHWIPSTNTKGRVFAGPPTEAIDAAWDELIFGRYVNFTESEVKWLNRDKGLPEMSFVNLSIPGSIGPGFYGGPDMLHSLHCINALRKHLDIDYYRERMTMFPRMHVDHCVDQLRQAALCHGDMTPVTLKPVTVTNGNVHILLGETERVHTCRNGEELAEAWRRRGDVTGRFNAS